MNKNFVVLFILFNTLLINSQSKIEKYSVATKISMDIMSDFYFEGIEVNAFSKSFIYSIGYYYGEDYEFLGDAPTERYKQLNFLFGKYIGDKKFRFQYQTGIGMFWGIKRTDELDLENSNILSNYYYTEKFSTIGIPIKIGGRYIPFKFLSIGIDLQANLNLSQTILRPMFSIEIGKLRN